MSQYESLASLLNGSEIISHSADSSDGNVLELPVKGIADNSKKVKQGDVFFAIAGSVENGDKYISEALLAGAIGVVTETTPHDTTFPYVQVSNVRLALALASKHFYGNPTAQLLNVAVTGTNGKTTIAWIIAEALARLGYGAAYVGTLGLHMVESHSPYKHALSRDEKITTPGPVATNKFLSDAKDAGAKAAVLEVSSHAIAQERVTGIEWDSAVFTNLTHDHLDFHGTLENYGATKEKLFTELLPASPHNTRVAAINIDDAFGREMSERLGERSQLKIITYSSRGNAAASCFVVSSALQSRGSAIEVQFEGQTHSIRTRLIGDYNVDNTIGALSCLVATGFPIGEVIAALADVPPVPGRLELVSDLGTPVFIDYAHTPDALRRAQMSVKGVTGGRLITVFGCGGDRDRGKRPVMGQEVAAQSDVAIVTSDNPRSEDPAAIISDILPGIQNSAKSKPGFTFEVVVDRREAIFRAVSLANPEDTILIAGKGHEDYQEIRGVRLPFLDRDVSAEALKSLGKKSTIL